jgi:hypothetical protein
MNTTQRVKEIRTKLKSLFPEVKFSVTKRHYNSMSISILSSPYDLTNEQHEQVNQWRIDEWHEGKAKEILTKVYEVSSEGITYRETGDYGTQPDFYVSINIGKWDKPYIKTNN